MPIYTRTGDKGDTTLFGGEKIPKDNPRVDAYGEVDELNAVLGIVIAFSEYEEITEPLKEIQKDLFIIGAELATEKQAAKVPHMYPQKVSDMEKAMDKIENELGALRHFILPGGSKLASLLHLARTVCRRAERKIVALAKTDKVNPEIVRYVNRLSDYLFMLARMANRKKRVEEIVWKGRS